jgi:hypothetical protein
MPQTVVLAGTVTYPQEVLAGEAGIMPGHLVTFGSSGTAGKLLKHATAAGNSGKLFADVNTTPDRSVTTEPVATAYASGEQMKWFMACPGAEVYAWVPASASAIIKGDMLVSNGDGTLKLYVPQASNEGGSATYTIQTNNVVAIAAEAKDNSAVGAAARIRVYVA